MQYGPRITAIILYLYVGQFLSKKRTAQALAELFGTPLSSEGTVAAHDHARPPTGWTGSSTRSEDRIVESDDRRVRRDRAAGRRQAGIGCTAPAPAATP